MAEAETQGLVAVGVVVAVAGEGLVRAVDASGVVEAGAEVETGLRIAARQPEAAFPGLLAAKAQVQARLQAGAVAAAGENLDHPANGVAAVDHRARAAQHFDAFDLLDIEVLQVAVAGGGVADALAVHQHQALRRFGAADIDRWQTAAPAGLGDLHARYAAQQVGDAAWL